MPEYRVHSIPDTDLGKVDFSAAETGSVACRRPESSDHTPGVKFWVLRGQRYLYVRFDVDDRYVRSVQTEFNSQVCTDSCVEFFVEPKPGRGYFNFEVNAGGTLLCYHVEDPTRTPQGLAKATALTPEECRSVEIVSTLPRTVDPEIPGPVQWSVRYRIPLALFTAHIGEVDFEHDWRANFYKCGDKTSHPHWMSWSPVSALNFHLPECFGTLKFCP